MTMVSNFRWARKLSGDGAGAGEKPEGLNETFSDFWVFMLLFSKVEKVSQLSGQGHLLTPNAMDAISAEMTIHENDPIVLRRPDGSVIRTHVHALRVSGGAKKCAWDFAIMLPSDVSNSEVPVGTEIWLP